MKRRGALALMALGILLAGGASMIVLGIARQAGEASRAVIPQVYVVMAAREIPDQAVVTPDALVIRPFPAEFAPVGAMSQAEQAVGKFAVGTIYKDQILLNGHVSTGKRAPSLSDRVPPGRVVIWMPMPDLLKGQIGFKPGDRLDILLSLSMKQPTAGDSAGTTPTGASGNGASEPRATVCRETVVSAPATAPMVIQPVILSLWLMGVVKSSRLSIYTWESCQTPPGGEGSRRRLSAM